MNVLPTVSVLPRVNVLPRVCILPRFSILPRFGILPRVNTLLRVQHSAGYITGFLQQLMLYGCLGSPCQLDLIKETAFFRISV